MNDAAFEAEDPHLLVVGYRRGLFQAIHERGLKAFLWNDKTIQNPKGITEQWALPFSEDRAKVVAVLDDKLKGKRISHVIAGKEGAVLTAGLARRVLGARSSKYSSVLRCRDKLKMKEALRQANIPLTDFMNQKHGDNGEEVLEKLGTPVVIKDRKGSGGRGMSLGYSPQEIARSINRNKILEKYVAGPEVSIESFVNRGKILFTNCTEYYRKMFINIVPGRVQKEVLDELLSMNARILESLKVTWGLYHTEFYLSKDGPMFGEIAMRPPGGYIMDLIELAYGFNPWRAFLAVELDEPFEFPKSASGFAAASILHPGKGEILSIRGSELLEKHPAIKKVKMKVKSGDQISHRVGVSDDCGYVLLHTATERELIEGIHFMDDTLQITMDSRKTRLSN